MTSQEVFKLRKEGKYVEALEMARKIYTVNPTDPWNLKALAWSLYSVVKEVAEGEEKPSLAEEFLALPIPEDDEYLANTRKMMESLSSPYEQELRRAKEASKERRFNEAMSSLRKLETQYPGKEDIETALAWELSGAIGRGLQEENPDGGGLWRLVEEYGRLRAVPKPSLVHSVMLQRVAGMAQKKLAPRFCSFAKWWGLEHNLRQEDYSPQERDEKRYDSLVERVITGIGKTIDACEDEQTRKTLAEFVNQHAGKYPNQEWFPYYRAVCLLEADRREDARPLMLEITRKKDTEFWAWEKLGRCFLEDSLERLQCLCRSYVMQTKGEEFKLTIFELLGEMLWIREMKGEARFLFEQARDVRQKRAWKVGEALQIALKKTEGIPPADPKGFVEQNAAKAKEVLLSGLPWLPAVVGKTDQDVKNREGRVKKYHFIALSGQKSEQEPAVARVPANQEYAKLAKMPEGAPIEVRVDDSGKYSKILAYRERPEGFAWDVYPEQIAILNRINADKEQVLGLLNNGFHITIPLRKFTQAKGWTVGQFVACRVRSGKDRVYVLSVRAVEGKHESEYWKEFRGQYRPRHNSSGGHVDRVFVAAHLNVNAHANQILSGLAIKRMGQDGQSWWEAVTARVGDEGIVKDQ